jgi:mRNA interferase RelE/StbE
MGYRIEFTHSADREFKKLEAVIKQRISDEVVGLETNPRPSGCAALKGYAHTYRIRVGDYRIIYQVHDKVLLVLVLKVGHRGDVYR